MIQIGVARTNRRLSHAVIGSTLATGLFLYVYLLLPVLAIPFLDSHWKLTLTSFLSLIIAINYRALWSKFQDISEKVANSRHDWLFADGRFRIINHSVYSGLAGAIGTAIASYILGNNLAVLLLTVCTLIGAAVFAQSLWGSHALLRPFGYWGAILGGIIGIGLTSFFFGIPLSTIALAGVLAAPFVQAIGRIRCLVQGCCHGIKMKKPIGIRVWHPQSRVVVLSGLKGEYLLNTQLYSILFNVLLGLLLWGMWLTQNMNCSFIIGQYIILTGIERFAEDAYRREKQTRMRKGLRENQWIAIGALISGVIITLLPSTLPSQCVGSFDLAFLATVLIGGLLTAFAMSMDFPKSQVRFSRLSG
jgi:hypothetical protein